MEGGWVLAALLWLLLCRAWEGEESPCRRPPPSPCVETARGMLCPPSFPRSETLPHALAQHPDPHPRQVLPSDGKVGTRGLGERGAAEELLGELPGAPGWQLPVPNVSGATGIPSPVLSSQLVFPSVFPRSLPSALALSPAAVFAEGA